MTATHGKAHENTTPAARAAAPAGAANSPAGPAGPGAEAAQPPAAGGGIIAALQRWWPDWTLEGPRKLTINTLIVIAGLLGSGVVVKATLKQVQVVEAISVPKDLESDGYTSAIVAQRLIDAASEITRTAALARRIGAYTLVESEPSRPIDRLRRPERGLCDGFGVQPHLRRPGQEIRRANGRPRSSVGSGAVIWLDLHN